MSGVIARFSDPPALVAAIQVLRERGYRRLDAVMPYEVETVERALAIPRSRIPWLIGAGATMGGSLALFILWWTNAHDYPIDVGGRPMFSFWADVPITFETAILSAGITGFVAFFASSGMPRLHHPWFEVEGTQEGFWLAVDASDPAFEDDLGVHLREAGAVAVERIEGDAT